MMDIHQILKQLPHRYPFLLVDRVLELEKGKRIKALKNVSMNEPFFSGHFPHRPVMPGVLMLEALAQAAALLAFRCTDRTPHKQPWAGATCRPRRSGTAGGLYSAAVGSLHRSARRGGGAAAGRHGRNFCPTGS